MARKWIEGVPDTKIETKAGAVWVRANGPEHISVNTKPIYGPHIGADEAQIVIRGVPYYVSATLIYVPADVFAPEDSEARGELRAAKGWRVSPASYQSSDGARQNWLYREGLYATRPGSFSRDSVSPAARRTIVELVEQVANEWTATDAGKEAIRVNSIASLSNDAARVEEKIAESEGQIRELRAQLRNLDKQIAKLSR
jgi:hypothetical protein